MADAVITFDQTWQNSYVSNVSVWSNVTVNPEAVQEFADAIRLAYQLGPSSILSNAWSLDGITVTFNPGPGQFSYSTGFTLGPLLGSSPAEETPAQSSLLVSTQYLGVRPNRGKFYFPGFPVTELVNGFWDSETAMEFQSMVENWALNGVTTLDGDWFLRIARRNAFGAITTSNPVSVAIGRENPGVQRRRRRRTRS